MPSSEARKGHVVSPWRPTMPGKRTGRGALRQLVRFNPDAVSVVKNHGTTSADGRCQQKGSVAETVRWDATRYMCDVVERARAVGRQPLPPLRGHDDVTQRWMTLSCDAVVPYARVVVREGGADENVPESSATKASGDAERGSEGTVRVHDGMVGLVSLDQSKDITTDAMEPGATCAWIVVLSCIPAVVDVVIPVVQLCVASNDSRDAAISVKDAAKVGTKAGGAGVSAALCALQPNTHDDTCSTSVVINCIAARKHVNTPKNMPSGPSYGVECHHHDAMVFPKGEQQHDLQHGVLERVSVSVTIAAPIRRV